MTGEPPPPLGGARPDAARDPHGTGRAAGRRQAATFPARMDAFPRIAAFAEGLCADAGSTREDGLKLTLVLEELFTNTVQHGHGRDSEAPVHLELEVGPARIALTYEDTAPPFDPFAVVADPPDEGVAIEDRAVGGLGLVLVTRLCSERRYAYAGGRNRIGLVLRPGP